MIELTHNTIRDIITDKMGYHGVAVPEFTFNARRIDLAVIDTKHRWIRGFEIKTRRSDFTRDKKWVMYSQFCSSVCIVCPEGLIQKEEVQPPFGLVWIERLYPDKDYFKMHYIRKPKNFQLRNSLSWIWNYIKVIEVEIVRIDYDLQYQKNRMKRAIEQYQKEHGGKRL